jgi:hypothetical protein
MAIALAAVVAVLPISSGLAQGTLQPDPYEAQLDGLLKARDTMALGRAIFPANPSVEITTRAANWLKTQEVAKGGSTLIAVLYAALLWRSAQRVPEPDKTRLSREAGTQYFLARLLIATEGFQCKDATALPAGEASIERQIGAVRLYVYALPESDRTALMGEAFKAMLATFPMRENDFWLCSLGSAQIGKYLEKHPEVGQMPVSGLEGKTIPGTPGKTVVLGNDPSILPDFVPYSDWQSRRRARIDATTSVLGIKPPADYADANHRTK